MPDFYVGLLTAFHQGIQNIALMIFEGSVVYFWGILKTPRELRNLVLLKLPIML